jgi:hypothetical protein
MGVCTCTRTSLQYISYVRLQHEAAVVHAWSCVDNTVYLGYSCTRMGVCTCTRTSLQYISYVRLQHEAAVVHAWSCVDNTVYLGYSCQAELRRVCGACTCTRTSSTRSVQGMGHVAIREAVGQYSSPLARCKEWSTWRHVRLWGKAAHYSLGARSGARGNT